MKLLLVQPPVEDFYDTEIRLQPIGLGYLKAAVRKWIPDIEVRIVDFHHGWGRRTVAVPAELKYLVDYYTFQDSSPFSTFHNYYRFGATESQMAEIFKREAPDWVGISSLFTPYYEQAIEVARIAKLTVGAQTILGGAHATAVPASLLESEWVDFVIRGEGELPLVALLDRLRAGRSNSRELSEVEGLCFKQGGATVIPKPAGGPAALDLLPFPDLSDLPKGSYTYKRKPLCFVVSSRGCPHECSFCSVHTTFGDGLRRRSVESILNEILERYRDGYRVFDFEDDNFTARRREVRELCEGLIARFPEGEIELLAMNGLSYLSLDPGLLSLMKRAGFSQLNLSLVSSNQSVLQGTKRPHTVRQFLEVMDAASAMGFQTVTYQILGLPIENLESMIQTMVFLAGQPTLLGASMFYLTPESPIARQLGCVNDRLSMLRSRLTAMAVETSEFDREEIFTLFVTCRIINFLKGVPVGSGKSIRLEEILDDPSGRVEARHSVGFELLVELLRRGRLSAATRNGLREQKHFKRPVFLAVWNALPFIRTMDGGRILLHQQVASSYATDARIPVADALNQSGMEAGEEGA